MRQRKRHSRIVAPITVAIFFLLVIWAAAAKVALVGCSGPKLDRAFDGTGPKADGEAISTLVETEAAGRAYATYGGISILAPLFWLGAVEGGRPRPLGHRGRFFVPDRRGGNSLDAARVSLASKRPLLTSPGTPPMSASGSRSDSDEVNAGRGF
jgi:hypothetical protein